MIFNAFFYPIVIVIAKTLKLSNGQNNMHGICDRNGNR